MPLSGSSVTVQADPVQVADSGVVPCKLFSASPPTQSAPPRAAMTLLSWAPRGSFGCTGARRQPDCAVHCSTAGIAPGAIRCVVTDPTTAHMSLAETALTEVIAPWPGTGRVAQLLPSKWAA